jgi:hypothetical protein
MPILNYKYEPVIRFESKTDLDDCFELDVVFASFDEAAHYAFLLEKSNLNVDLTYVDVNMW